MDTHREPVETTFQPVDHAARRLGVPAAWLRREFAAGRLPGVRAGRRVLIHTKKAGDVIARLAETHASGEAAGGNRIGRETGLD